VIAYNGGDYCAEEIAVSERGTSFTVTAPGGERERFTVRLIGRHNVVNLVGAIAVAHSLGVPLQSLKGQMRKLAPVPHRLELIDRGGGLVVIDDAYNSNPAGAKAALDTLALFDGCKILITPGMVELGDMQYEANYNLGKQAAAVCDYVFAVGERQAPPILAGLNDAGYPAGQTFTAQSFKEAIDKAYALPYAGEKIILLENDLPDNY